MPSTVFKDGNSEVSKQLRKTLRAPYIYRYRPVPSHELYFLRTNSETLLIINGWKFVKVKTFMGYYTVITPDDKHFWRCV